MARARTQSGDGRTRGLGDAEGTVGKPWMGESGRIISMEIRLGGNDSGCWAAGVLEGQKSSLG